LPVITVITLINAPVERCFDLSRSIDLHVESTKQTGETAIAGRTKGLIELHESVTWRGKHLGLWQILTSRITEFKRPYLFVDEMTEGAFKSLRHEHHFTGSEGSTTMKDVFVFESPFGFAGRLFNFLFLTKYMTRFLKKRNAVIKECAEGQEWMKYTSPTSF
jgi:ligand-binding SRPBCC domain-containing protein